MNSMRPGRVPESIEQLIRASSAAPSLNACEPVHILSEMLLKLADCSSPDNIYTIMGQALHRLVPDSVVMINSFDHAAGTMRVESLEGAAALIQKIAGLLGAHPLDIVFTISTEAREGLSSGKLERVPGNLYALTMGNIPKRICSAIESLLDTREVYAIGLLENGDLLGSASFLLRKSNTSSPGVVETFVRLASIALHKWKHEESERQSQRQHREIVHTFSRLLQTSTDMIFTIDREGRFLNANQATYNELGYTEAELKKVNLFSLVFCEDLVHTRDQVSHVYKGKSVHIFEYRCRGKKGPITISMSACPFSDSTGAITGVLCIGRNVSGRRQMVDRLRSEHTVLERQLVERAHELEQANVRLKQELQERRSAEEETRRSRTELETLMQTSPAIICRSDLTTRVLYVNRRFEEFTGYRSEEVLGKYWPSLGLLPFDTGTLLRRMKKKLKHNDVRSIEVAVRCKSGEIKYASGMGTLIFEKGLPAGFQVVALDISERKQAENRAEQSTGMLLKALEDMIEAMAHTVELRDPYTAGHQRRVAQLAFTMGAKIGLPDDQLVGIRLAGLVHDIGKIRVPAEILTHPNGLTGAEMSIIRTHPTVGYEIVKNIAFPWPIAQAVLQHHERLDGSGYPDGLSAKEIIPEAKILAVADVVEAMASHRPYRPSLGVQKAMEEIKANRGRLYDADAVDCCVHLFEKSGFIFGQSPLSVY